MGKPGKRPLHETAPKMMTLALKLRSRGMSLAAVSVQLAAKGHFNSTGKAYSASVLNNAMLRAQVVVV